MMRINIKSPVLAAVAGMLLSVAANSQSVSNNAPTLGPVIRAYYHALKKRDDAAVVRVLSIKFLREVKADMKREGRKDLAAFLAETDYRKGSPPIQVRNEILDGDRGRAEVKGVAYRSWTLFAFIKEKGTWRLSGENAENWNLTPESH